MSVGVGVSVGKGVSVAVGSAVSVGGGGVTLGAIVTSGVAESAPGVERGVQATKNRTMTIGASRDCIP